MSKLTKFLHQSAQWQSNTGSLDIYGEPEYGTVTSIKCRKTQYIKDVLTSTGSMAKSSNRYIVDNTVKIQIGDLLDGQPIVLIEDYVNAQGIIEGYQAIV